MKDNFDNAGVDFDEDCSSKDIWSKKVGDETEVDANVIDDGIVAINYKDNKEIEEKLDKELEDNYIVVVETIYDIKVGIVHEDETKKTNLTQNSQTTPSLLIEPLSLKLMPTSLMTTYLGLVMRTMKEMKTN